MDKNSMTGTFTMSADNVELVVHNPPETKEPTAPKVTEKNNG